MWKYFLQNETVALPLKHVNIRSKIQNKKIQIKHSLTK